MLHTFSVSILTEKNISVSGNMATNYRIPRLHNQMITIRKISAFTEYQNECYFDVTSIFNDG